MDVNLDRVVCSWSCSGRDVEVCGVCGGWFCDYHFPSHLHSDRIGDEQPAAIRHCPGAEWPHKPHWWDSAGQVYSCDGEPDTRAGNSAYWPPTSELDPHLVPKPADPAPTGLTAAQEIRGIALRAAVKLVIPIEPDVTEDEPQDGVEGPIRDALLVAGRFAAWITGAPDTAACPDPAMHDPLRGDIAAQRDAAQKRGDAYRDLLDKARDEIAELRTGRLEAEADFEASLAREQIATERVAKLAALVECRCGPEWTERSMHGPACDQLQVRAILADQGEEA
jgi:hypothetical protein